MSSYSGSVHGSDDGSEVTLIGGETVEGSDIYLNEKTAYDTRTNSHPTAISVFLLSLTLSIARCLASLSSSLGWAVTPSFLRTNTHRDATQEKLNSTAYLDGMRGLAAFSVFLCHLSYGTWDTGHVYGAGETGDNNHILQLPVMRLIYAGPPMVAIFFVISGYALSFKPARLMRTQQHEELMTAVTSSIFRRALRLFVPCFASTFMVSLLCQLGYYKRTEQFAHNMRAISEDHAWTEPDPLSQLLDWFRQVAHFVNVFDWSLYAGSIALDRHLWTIPAEYRCSLALFLTHMLTARMSSSLRLCTILGLVWWGMHWNRWEMIPFWAGMFLAEMDDNDHLRSIQDSSAPTLISAKPLMSRLRWSWWKVLYILTFSCGLYLASFPDSDGHATPGYIYLNSLIPEYWTEKHRFWPTVAAIQIVWSASKLNFLKQIFTSRAIQYIGQISFPLYLMHGPVIHTFGYMVMEHIYAYTGTEDRTQLQIGFIAAASMIIIVVIWTSDIFWRVVDKPSVKFARWLEAKMFVS